MKAAVLVFALVGCFLVLAPSASSTFAGANGEIAYTTGGVIRIVNPDGSGQEAVTGNLCATNVAWSPDGRKIAFDGGCTPPSRIFVVDASGKPVKALTDSGCADVQPSWSPDGSHIVFRRGVSANGVTDTCDNELWTMRANGHDQQQLTHDGVNANDQDPSWSPDGTRIAFYRFSPTFQIWVLDLATGVETDIDQTGGTFGDTDPDWSPDSTKITFTRCCTVGNEVAVMDANGSNQTVLTNDSGNGDFESKWSPDGTRIAFVRAVAPAGIYTMSSGGADVASLGTGTVDFSSISWRPCLKKCA